MESNDPLSETSTTSLLATTPELPPPTLQVQPVNESASRSEDVDDQASIYWSVRSRLSFSRLSLSSFDTSSIFTSSTGRRSQDGATWKYALSQTMNSGFASGTPRSMNYKGVREGREKGGFLPRITGVGRTGKGPAAIPQSMLRALGVQTQESRLECIGETNARETKEAMAQRYLDEAAATQEQQKLREAEATALMDRRKALKDDIESKYQELVTTWRTIKDTAEDSNLPISQFLADSFTEQIFDFHEYLGTQQDNSHRDGLGRNERLDPYLSQEVFHVDQLHNIPDMEYFHRYHAKAKWLRFLVGNLKVLMDPWTESRNLLDYHPSHDQEPALRKTLLFTKFDELVRTAENTEVGQVALRKCLAALNEVPGVNCENAEGQKCDMCRRQDGKRAGSMDPEHLAFPSYHDDGNENDLKNYKLRSEALKDLKKALWFENYRREEEIFEFFCTLVSY